MIFIVNARFSKVTMAPITVTKGVGTPQNINDLFTRLINVTVFLTVLQVLHCISEFKNLLYFFKNVT